MTTEEVNAAWTKFQEAKLRSAELRSYCHAWNRRAKISVSLQHAEEELKRTAAAVPPEFKEFL